MTLWTEKHVVELWSVCALARGSHLSHQPKGTVVIGEYRSDFWEVPPCVHSLNRMCSGVGDRIGEATGGEGRKGLAVLKQSPTQGGRQAVAGGKLQRLTATVGP